MHHSLYAGLVISENQNPFVLPALLSGGATLLLKHPFDAALGSLGNVAQSRVVQGCFNNWWIRFIAAFVVSMFHGPNTGAAFTSSDPYLVTEVEIT